jgi:hypothetical protein
MDRQLACVGNIGFLVTPLALAFLAGWLGDKVRPRASSLPAQSWIALGCGYFSTACAAGTLLVRPPEGALSSYETMMMWERISPWASPLWVTSGVAAVATAVVLSGIAIRFGRSGILGVAPVASAIFLLPQIFAARIAVAALQLRAEELEAVKESMANHE